MRVHLTFLPGFKAICGHPDVQEIVLYPSPEVTCVKCLKIFEGTWGNHPRSPWRWSDVKPCGTMAAVSRHRRHGEPLDVSCKQAEARRNADKYAARKARSA